MGVMGGRHEGKENSFNLIKLNLILKPMFASKIIDDT